MRRMGLALVLWTALATAQHIEPKASATAYPVHAKFGDFSVGADFLVHTIPGDLGGLFAGDFLTIEAAFFGPWEAKWRQMNDGRSREFRDINNPKIPVRYVQTHGELVYRVRHPTPKVKKPKGQAKRTEEGDVRHRNRSPAK